jgi:hypothetical protein
MVVRGKRQEVVNFDNKGHPSAKPERVTVGIGGAESMHDRGRGGRSAGLQTRFYFCH